LRRTVAQAALLTLAVIAITQITCLAIWGGTDGGYELSIMVAGALIPLATCFPISMFLLVQRRSLATALSGMEQAHRELQEQASRDPMTGLLHRQAFFAKLSFVESPGGCFLMIDVDHFKAVNDTNGHAAGDQALRLIADALADTVGDTGAVARYGGEEFCIYLPLADPLDGHRIGENVRRRVGKIEFSPGGVRRRLTVSIGVAALDLGADVETAISAADAALYEAKSEGRNRVVCAPTPSRIETRRNVA